MSTSIVIIEDNLPYANNLKDYLQLKGFEVRGIFSTVKGYINASNAIKENLNLIILDINLADNVTGIEGLHLIKEDKSTADIIILSSHDDAKYIFQALCNGAIGFLTKGMNLSEIYNSINEVLDGGSCMTPSIARKVVNYFGANPTVVNSNFDALTARELEIVEGIKDGLSYKLFGYRLGISIETVRFHVKNIYKKLHVNSKTEVVNAYFNSGR